MTTAVLLLTLLAVEPASKTEAKHDSIAVGHRLDVHTQPADQHPEFGGDLSSAMIEQGWLSLYDGNTTFGWTGSKVEERVVAVSGGRDAKRQTLVGGRTTTRWCGKLAFRLQVESAGSFVYGDRKQELTVGWRYFEIDAAEPTVLALADGLAVSSLAMRFSIAPLEEASWRVIKHPRNSSDKQTRWSFAKESVRAVGGPGCVELQDRLLGDFVLQAEVTTHRPLANGGIFFRAIPGDFMNGYEAQIFNGCLDQDPARPSKWSTGAIDDRQNARRVVSRDGTPFSYTINADGPHIAVWINGYQQVDWTDERPEDDNARKGRRTKPGALQLQAHDAETDVEFANVRIQSLDEREFR